MVIYPAGVLPSHVVNHASARLGKRRASGGVARRWQESADRAWRKQERAAIESAAAAAAELRKARASQAAAKAAGAAAAAATDHAEAARIAAEAAAAVTARQLQVSAITNSWSCGQCEG